MKPCQEKKTTLRAFADFDPMLHQVVCGCGYETDKLPEFDDVMKALKAHRGAVEFVAVDALR